LKGAAIDFIGQYLDEVREVAAYAPTDNVSELTARVNDDGCDTALANCRRGGRRGLYYRPLS
jgi:hypothetical protein